MRVKIVIECEDIKDLMTHLSVIRSQIKKSLPSDKTVVIEDETFYGGHKVTICSS